MIDVNSLVGDWDWEDEDERTRLFVSRRSGYELHTSRFENDKHFVMLADHETHETVAEVEVSNEDEEGAAVLMLMGATSHPEVFNGVAEAIDGASETEEPIFESG
jgi:predicted lactoylglutathione lyase